LALGQGACLAGLPNPQDPFRLYAVCARFLQLAGQVPWQERLPGVYDCWWGTDVVRVVVAGLLARETHNAPLHLFSASPEVVGFGWAAYRRHEIGTPVQDIAALAMKLRNRWLCLGPILLLVLDISLTLYGQPAAYWQGDLEQVREWSPYAHWLLRQHPLLVLANAALWVPIFSSAILWLPPPFAKIIAFVIHVGHTLGAASWLVLLAPGSYATALLFLLMSVKLMDWSWGRQDAVQPGPNTSSPRGERG